MTEAAEEIGDGLHGGIGDAFHEGHIAGLFLQRGGRDAAGWLPAQDQVAADPGEAALGGGEPTPYLDFVPGDAVDAVQIERRLSAPSLKPGETEFQ